MNQATTGPVSPPGTSGDSPVGRWLVAIVLLVACLFAGVGFVSTATATTPPAGADRLAGTPAQADVTAPPTGQYPTMATTVQVEPAANLTISPTPANPGEPVTLDASRSSGSGNETVAQCSFDVDGDGAYDVTTQSCVHETTYDAVGTYEVTVRATTASGNSPTASATLSVQPATTPIARIDVTPDSPRVGETVTLSGAGSSDADGSIVQYTWTVEERTLSGETVTYRPNSTGEQSVTLGVRDDDGTENATTRTVVVEQNRPPRAALAVSPDTPTVGESIVLDAGDSTDPDGDTLGYRWDVDGDGTIDRETGTAETTFEVVATGTHTASVTVVDEHGGTDSTAVEYDVSTGSSTAGAPARTATVMGTDSSPTRSADTGPIVGVGGHRLLDALDPGLVPIVPDWLALVLVAVAAGAIVTFRRRAVIRTRIDEYRRRVRTGQFRRKVAKSASGFVAKSIAKRIFRRGADLIEWVANGVGDAFERVGQAIKNGGRRVASVLRKLGE